MENASKALLMAGSVLIALIIIGALLLMFNNLSNYQDVETQTEAEAQVVAFNNQFETYNRKDVRGNDLYSLLNRVIDYNRRKSTEGTGTTDEGQYLAYEPMTITYTLNSEKGKASDLTYRGTNQIFNGNYANFKLNDKTTNDFEKHVNQKITKIEEDYATKSGLQSLVAGISNLFYKTEEKDKLAAIKLWDENVYEGKRTTQKTTDLKYKEINTQANRTAIFIYYEFVQFKRAKFECTNVTYNQKTGRIIQMDFSFTGKIE